MLWGEPLQENYSKSTLGIETIHSHLKLENKDGKELMKKCQFNL